MGGHGGRDPDPGGAVHPDHGPARSGVYPGPGPPPPGQRAYWGHETLRLAVWRVQTGSLGQRRIRTMISLYYSVFRLIIYV